MTVPFSTSQFFDVFRQYNEAVWPMQLALLAAGFAAVLLAWRGGPRAGPAISGILALLWMWMGAVYHIAFFRTINPVAAVFGALFIVQGLLFAWLGAWKRGLTFAGESRGPSLAAALMIVYALVLYPLLGSWIGHRYPATPTFGVPCPTTIFTLGLLVWARPPVTRTLVVVPILWAVVGTVGAIELSVPEDFGLPISALVATLAVLRHGRRDIIVRAA